MRLALSTNDCPFTAVLTALFAFVRAPGTSPVALYFVSITMGVFAASRNAVNDLLSVSILPTAPVTWESFIDITVLILDKRSSSRCIDARSNLMLIGI